MSAGEGDALGARLAADGGGHRASGEGPPWRPDPGVPPKLLTLVIVQPPPGNRLLLGRKKRGFGAGYYNGFGGKVEPGETVEAAARREARTCGRSSPASKLEEEACIRADDMTPRGLLMFHFEGDPRPWEVAVYSVASFTGEPAETDEMEPIWFTPEELPYDKMWADDAHWYPLFLSGKNFHGDFWFRETTKLVYHELKEGLPPAS